MHKGKRRIVIDFDIDTFDEVRAMARRGGVSFQQQVRLLVEFGIEDAKSARG